MTSAGKSGDTAASAAATTDLAAADAFWSNDRSFDLVVALGVHASAGDVPSFERALDETVHVLATDGRVLVSTFSPAS